MKNIFVLVFGSFSILLAAQLLQARGFGGAHPSGGASEGNRGGESRSEGSHENGAEAGAYHGGEPNRNAQPSGKEDAAAGAAVSNRNAPKASGAEGAAAGAGVANRNEPKASGAEGAAAGAAVSNRNSPQYSGAEGAVAGAAVANRNSPQYSGAEGAAAGAAVANRNSPQYSGAAGAAAGYAAASGNQSGGYYAGAVQGLGVGNVGLPTDTGYGMAAAGVGAAGYAANHSTQPVNAGALAASGAAVRNSNPGAGAFNQSWYAAHPGAWAAGGWADGDAWHAASWPAIAPALGWAANVQPTPYNYGANITYQGNQVYAGGQPVATSDQYYQQAATVAQSAPPANPQSSDWMPLGVFAMVHQEQSTPKYVLQLAVNKSVVLAGNYCDLISDTLQPIQGAVDKKTQRVAWTVGNNKNTVGEAGLYNLTQDEAPALIHVGKDKTQQWLLVRLKQQ